MKSESFRKGVRGVPIKIIDYICKETGATLDTETHEIVFMEVFYGEER